MEAANSGSIPTVLFYSPKNDYLDQIVKNAADSLGLKYEACANAKELESRTASDNGIAGVQFDQSLKNSQSFPNNFDYILRFPSELRTTSSLTPATWLTWRLYPEIPSSGPRNKMYDDGGSSPGYLREAFLPIQNALSMSFLRLKANQPTLQDVMLQRFPYPEYHFDLLHSNLSSLLVLIITTSFIYSCTCITKVSEAIIVYKIYLYIYVNLSICKLTVYFHSQ